MERVTESQMLARDILLSAGSSSEAHKEKEKKVKPRNQRKTKKLRQEIM